MATVLGGKGWECGNDMYNDVDGSATLSASLTEAHSGAYSMRLINEDWAREAIGDANPSTSIWIYLGGGFDLTGAKLEFILDTGEMIRAQWNGVTHTIDAYVDDVLAASGSVEVRVNDWFHVQFYVEIADAGHIYMLIDGHESINQAYDTQPAGAAVATYVRYTGHFPAAGFTYIDDWVWGYDDYLGDLRCPDIRPNADTAQDDWTPSAGDNYSTVNETPPNDATYNETNTNGHIDELAMADFDDTLMTPRAVVAYARVRMEGAFGDSFKVGIDSNGTDVTTEYTLSAAYEYYTHGADVDPDGDIAWTDAAVDALLLRYESVIA